MNFARLPNLAKLALFAMALAILLYLTLEPSEGLPSINLWDKFQHATAWAVLAVVGLLLWPWRMGPVLAFGFAFGALVEVLQFSLPIGRDGDIRDLVADSVGLAVVGIVWILIRKRLPRRVDGA